VAGDRDLVARVNSLIKPYKGEDLALISAHALLVSDNVGRVVAYEKADVPAILEKSRRTESKLNSHLPNMPFMKKIKELLDVSGSRCAHRGILGWCISIRLI